MLDNVSKHISEALKELSKEEDKKPKVKMVENLLLVAKTLLNEEIARAHREIYLKDLILLQVETRH